MTSMSQARSIVPVILLGFFLGAASSVAIADRTFSSLEERMTGQEFRETGLYKLDDEELAALNRWIRQRSLAEEERESERERGAARAEDDRATEDRRGLTEPQDRSTIHSRIAGTFNGWDGDTVFELENGMVWRQVDSTELVTPEMESPAVEIKPGMLGSWQLQVEGYNRRARVERIE